MRKALLGVFLALFCAVAARAQAPYKVQIVVDGDKTPVAAAVEARIGGTTRYVLADNVSSDGFLLGIMCHQNELQSGVAIGYTCVSLPKYYPPGRYSSVSEDVAPAMVACGGNAPEECAEGLFDEFVKSTQPDKLKEYDKLAYSEYIIAYEQGYIVGMAMGSDSCKGGKEQKKPQKVKKP